jgi:MYXO-CTERM domain-containing protein
VHITGQSDGGNGSGSGNVGGDVVLALLAAGGITVYVRRRINKSK